MRSAIIFIVRVRVRRVESPACVQLVSAASLGFKTASQLILATIKIKELAWGAALICGNTPLQPLPKNWHNLAWSPKLQSSTRTRAKHRIVVDTKTCIQHPGTLNIICHLGALGCDHPKLAKYHHHSQPVVLHSQTPAPKEKKNDCRISTRPFAKRRILHNFRSPTCAWVPSKLTGRFYACCNGLNALRKNVALLEFINLTNPFPLESFLPKYI